MNRVSLSTAINDDAEDILSLERVIFKPTMSITLKEQKWNIQRCRSIAKCFPVIGIVDLGRVCVRKYDNNIDNIVKVGNLIESPPEVLSLNSLPLHAVFDAFPMKSVH